MTSENKSYSVLLLSESRNRDPCYLLDIYYMSINDFNFSYLRFKWLNVQQNNLLPQVSLMI